MTTLIESNLIQNALDYLILAGEQAETDEPRMLKHAIANLGDGTELLLKACLEGYDWSLIFGNVDDADRNQVRHFGICAEKNTLVSLLVKVYNFTIDFVKTHIEGLCKRAIGGQLATLRRLLGKSEPFVNQRLADIKPEMTKHDLHLECPKCLQSALCITDQGGQCLFCGHTCAGASGAEEWVDHEYELGSPKEKMLRVEHIASCPQCGAPACVMVPDTRTADGTSKWVCFSCGESSNYDFCTRCGALFEYDEEDGSVVCEDCIADTAQNDD